MINKILRMTFLCMCLLNLSSCTSLKEKSSKKTSCIEKDELPKLPYETEDLAIELRSVCTPYNANKCGAINKYINDVSLFRNKYNEL